MSKKGYNSTADTSAPWTEKSSLMGDVPHLGNSSKLTDDQNVFFDDLKGAMKNAHKNPKRFDANYRRIRKALDVYDQSVNSEKRANTDMLLKLFTCLVWLATAILACFSGNRYTCN
jgi:hypothetical protein